MQLSTQLSSFKKELSQTKASLKIVSGKLNQKLSERLKLDEEIAKLRRQVDQLETERFSDNLIDFSAHGNFFQLHQVLYKRY